MMPNNNELSDYKIKRKQKDDDEETKRQTLIKAYYHRPLFPLLISEQAVLFCTFCLKLSSDEKELLNESHLMSVVDKVKTLDKLKRFSRSVTRFSKFSKKMAAVECVFNNTHGFYRVQSQFDAAKKSIHDTLVVLSTLMMTDEMCSSIDITEFNYHLRALDEHKQFVKWILEGVRIDVPNTADQELLINTKMEMFFNFITTNGVEFLRPSGGFTLPKEVEIRGNIEKARASLRSTYSA